MAKAATGYWWHRPYLSQEALVGFDTYRYSCQDTNPLSKYILHPFWNKAVLLCPRWIAPNLLTFTGFVCCFLHYLVPAFYDYDFTASTLGSTHPVPWIVWFMSGTLLFLSHTLDGIDGKQARRTGTSSPVGEMFDHGCDAWAMILTTSTFYSVFSRNIDGYSLDPIRMYGVIWLTFISFHISHWEKYNTGIMYLPWTADVSMAGGALLYIITSIIGVEAYKFHLLGLNLANMVEVTIYAATFLLTIPVSLHNTYLSYKEGTGKMRPFLELTRPLVSLLIQMTLCWMWVLLSKNNIVEADPRCFYYMSGTLYSNVVARLIVSQMSGTRCELLSPGLLPLAASVAISLVIPGLPMIGELAVLYILTALLTASHLHYAVCVLIQMCQHLNINLFTIKPKDEISSQNGSTNNRRTNISDEGNEDKDRLLSNHEDIDIDLSSDSDEIAHYNEGPESSTNLQNVEISSTSNGQSRHNLASNDNS